MSDSQPFPAPRRPPRPRRAVAIVVILVLVASAGTALFWAGRHTAPDSRAGNDAARSRSSRAVVTGPASEPAAAGPQEPAIDLASLRWSDFYGVELPVSASAGPRHVRAGRAWGFTDTPPGALLAAVNIGVRANAQWGPGIFGPTIADQVVKGPAATALLAACQASYAQTSPATGVTGGHPLGRAFVVEQAFRWVTYTPADATVDVVSAGPGQQGITVRAVTRIEVQWSGTDWQVIAPPGGDWGNSAAPLTSLNGYTILPVPAD
jgi:hypothetical protein